MDSNSSGLSSDSSAPEAVRRRGLHALQKNSLELHVHIPLDVQTWDKAEHTGNHHKCGSII